MRLFCDIVAGVVAATAFQPETFLEVAEADETRRDVGGCVYVSGFLFVMGVDKTGFIPLSYRTGRDEADGGDEYVDVASKNWYLPFILPLDSR